MKIGILTQPLHTNYGGLLQNYALQQVLIGFGNDPETICYENKKKKLTFVGWLSYVKRILLHCLNPQKFKGPKYEPSDQETTYIRQYSQAFIEKYIRKTELLISHEDFVALAQNSKYKAYVVGSDQCWRPRYNKTFLCEMFLKFVEHNNDVKRLAYAISFGTAEWEMNPEQTEECSVLAQKFDMVTAREDTGVELCRRNLGVDAKLVLDPTLLLTKQDYIKLVEYEKPPVSQGNLFYYLLDTNKSKLAAVNSIGEKYRLRPFRVMPLYKGDRITRDVIQHHLDDCVFPPVTSWLRAFMDSEMTIVDSFHGMVFSIIFNKPFWVIGNKNRGMSRFTSLLELLGLESRLTDAEKLANVDINEPINWSNVNCKIDEMRRKSLAILENSLSNVRLCQK